MQRSERVAAELGISRRWLQQLGHRFGWPVVLVGSVYGYAYDEEQVQQARAYLAANPPGHQRGRPRRQ